MIITEYYLTRNDGVKLYKTYSDQNLRIKQLQTDAIYDEAVDVENSGFTYEETSTPIEYDNEEEEIMATAKQYILQNLIELKDKEDDPDYLNEHETESNYFN